MKSKKHLIIIVAITMVAAVVSVQLCGCFSIAHIDQFKKLFEDSGPRGLYSAGVAQDYFKLHTEALDAAADWFKANPNVVYVIKGADSSYNNRTYTKIGELGVFSSEELSQDEINGIQTFVQPLFDDPLMTSVRRLPSRFAEYVMFFFYSRFGDSDYLLCKEIERTGEGRLVDEWSYIVDQVDLGNDWYTVKSTW